MKEHPPPQVKTQDLGGNYGEKTGDNEMCIGKLRGESRKTPPPAKKKAQSKWRQN